MSKIKILTENNIQFEAEGNDHFIQTERKAFVDMISDKSIIKSVTALQEAGIPPQQAPNIRYENVVIFDDAGIPSIMVKFTKTTNKELFGGSDKTHPAFIIGGKEYDEIYISKYPNTLINGKPYSLPFNKPATNIANDDATAACFSKGEGWHMVTAPEWGLLALDSLKNGTLPHGNTNSGQYNNTDEKGVTYDGSCGKTLTGSGPATWTHSHTPEGVHDLCGNVWEMVRGLRIINGVIQTPDNNDAALDIDLTKTGKAWKDITDDDGNTIRVSVADDGILITTDEDIEQDYSGSRWEGIEINCQSDQLKELALFNGEPNAYCYLDSTEGEYFPIRGGGWGGGASAGVFAASLGDPRSLSVSPFGFRSAFYRKTGN